ncbi:transmembrane and immunoglobulin domain-containing protein 2 [Microtus oregoni]|uniref:transmembrane and immunoglobulin domain-containing protein 2 n=1 Tax=Microtus oregoni TaxID=111838 RepID=UPI001BB28A4D|nr:transmembrane and immunoglobulin domain-containing protein 2 [Microtus oregoni]
MESPGWAFILLQFWGLQEAVSLSVEQWPHSMRVTQGDEMWLSCGVNQSQAWERLRVEWIRDKVVLCHLLISNGNLSTVDCGARGQLSWQSLTNFSLRLDHLSLNDSGDYMCRATLEIPKLQKAEGNGTKVLVEAGDLQLKETSSGLLLMLLVAGGVVAALVVLGAVLWGLSRCRREDSATSFTGPGRSHPGLGPGLRRRMQAVNREPRLYIPPPSPNLLHANFRSPNPAPGPGLATPSQSTVRLLQVAGSRERPPAERNPRSQRGIGDP